MERYSEYKDSGMKWLGEIPSHWSILMGKHLFQIQCGYPFNSQNFTNDSGFPLIRIRDITSGKTETYYKGTYDTDYIVHSNDLLIGMDGDFNVRWWESEDALLNQRCCRVNNNSKIEKKYLFYYLPIGLKVSNDLTPATTVKHLSDKDLKNMPILLPSIIEQQQIIKHLDYATSIIDKAIAQQQKMIDLLNERKQIIINNAVTKGLDYNVKMKPSGVDWIGDVPKHWEMRRLKTILYIKDKRNSDPNAVLLSVYTAIGVKPRKELEEKGNKASTVIDYKIVNKGDLIVNRLLAWMGAYGLSNYEGVTSPDYDVYSFRNGYSRNYYEIFFRNTQFKSDCYKYGHGIMMMRWRTYSDEFLNILVPVPPLKEQERIFEYLYPHINKINEEIERCNTMISLLQERKQIIINDVVTGKVKVV